MFNFPPSALYLAEFDKILASFARQTSRLAVFPPFCKAESENSVAYFAIIQFYLVSKPGYCINIIILLYPNKMNNK